MSHMTFDDRVTIQEGLDNQLKVSTISRKIGKERSTVTREIEKHKVYKGLRYPGAKSPCAHKGTCNVHGLCEKKFCNSPCRDCFSCKDHCPEYFPSECLRLAKSPHVCNGCDKISSCTYERYFYYATFAQNAYHDTLISSREGINQDPESLQKLDTLVSPLLKKGQWEIEITETDYNPDSADNSVRPDAYIEVCDDYAKTLLIDAKDVSYTNEKKIIMSVSFYTPHDDFAFVEDNKLFLFLNDTVCIVDVSTGNVLDKKELDMMGTLFSAHKYQDDFILYCEMDIIRMTPNLDVKWDFSARDIFVRYQGEEPAFEMRTDRIRLYDFSDNYYEIDYDGRVIRAGSRQFLY